MSPQKALEIVGNKLQEQYERWQPRVRWSFWHNYLTLKSDQERVSLYIISRKIKKTVIRMMKNINKEIISDPMLNSPNYSSGVLYGRQ